MWPSINFAHQVLVHGTHSLNDVLGSQFNTIGFIGIIFLLLLFFYIHYILNIKPLNWVRKISDIGYICDAQEDRRSVANQVQKLRSVGNLPPIYPNGWYAVIETYRVSRATTHTINMIGKTFAVFRSEQGVAHVLDAYCPHMGANLGAGGKVKGNCIECPFHGWCFDGDSGKCVSIPYMKGNNIPEAAAVISYEVAEVNGFINIWFDAENRKSTWQIPLIDEIHSRQWTYRGRSEHIINAHIEEIPENGADIAHFQTVHCPNTLAGVDLRFVNNRLWSFGQHDWSAQWYPLMEPNQHISEMKLVHNLKIFGFKVPFLLFEVLARQIGPALVHIHFSSVFGKGVFVQCVTPKEPLIQCLVHNTYVTKWMPNLIAKFFMIAEILQVERDAMIWNNKRFMSKPVLVRSNEDSLISKHRRWYSQFYSQHSPRMRLAQDETLEW